jgi:hypothetical protein
MVVLLVGCDTPSPYFRGAEVTRIEVQGSVFDVRRRGKLAEAIRTNAEYAPRLGKIARRAEIAIETVTGCPVKELRGDAAVVLGILKCGKPDDLAKIGKGAPPITLYCDPTGTKKTFECF